MLREFVRPLTKTSLPKSIKRIVFLDFIHRLVSQEQTKLKKLKIIDNLEIPDDG
jgi:hypothetical protein